MTITAPWRRLLAEFLGTALLVTAVVGSGMMATTLSPHDVGLQLLENSTATAFALGALILMFGPVSGAHFNPVVSIADWYLGPPQPRHRHVGPAAARVCARASGRRDRRIHAGEPDVRTAGGAVLHQGRARPVICGSARSVATAGLVLLVFALARVRSRRGWRPPQSARTSARRTGSPRRPSFANPAVTIGRAFTDTFAGIAPSSVPAFVVAQLVGLSIAVGLVIALYPHASRAADDVVVPHPADTDTAEPALHPLTLAQSRTTYRRKHRR